MSSTLLHSSMQALAAQLERACALDFPYEERYLSAVGKKAAVVMLFAFAQDGTGPYLLFIKRTEKVETHKGQMAFPGGAHEVGDASLEMSAQRELREELGIPPSCYRGVGILPRLWTVTGFLVTPYVAVSEVPIEEMAIVPDPHEVEEFCWLSFADFLNAENFSQEWREYPPQSGKRYAVQVYQIGKYKVWGATGSMMKNLLDRLNSLG